MVSEIKELYSNKNVEKSFSQENLIKMLIHSPRVKNEYRKIKKKQTIVPVKNNEIYFLTSGLIVSQYEDQPINLKSANQFIGLDTIILQEDQMYNYQALVDSEVIVFETKEVLMELFSQQEGWLFLTLEMQKQIKLLTDKYLIMQKNSFARLTTTFFELALRFGVKQKDAYILPEYFSKKFIADYSGLSPSSVKKIEVLLREEGIIKFIDKRYVVYLEKSTYYTEILDKY